MNERPINVLSRMIPDEPHNYIFGDVLASEDVTVTEDAAIRQSQQRPVEKVSIYVVSTNTDQMNKLRKICASIPSNFVVLDGDDFFKAEEGRYNGMGTDRLATITGAVYLHGHPALVFDGGTATTYTATNSEGKVLGGGIGPGIQSKLRSMSNDADALPTISAQEVVEMAKGAQESGKPLPTFAQNTKEAMMVDVFQEFAGKGRNVIEKWIANAYPDEEKQPPRIPGTKYNESRIVTVTGGDGDILSELLQPHHGGLIEPPNDDATDAQSNKLEYEVQLNKHLIHYGISAILQLQVLARKNKAIFCKESSSESHVGKRVAKVFDVETDDGDNIFRGRVAKEIVVEGKGKHYRINYDDGDAEDVTAEVLFDMFDLYKRHGEKPLYAKAQRKHGKRTAKQLDDEKLKNELKNAITKIKSNAEKAPKFPMKSASKKHSKRGAENGKVVAAKKAKTSDDVKELVQSDPRSFVNKRVAKNFDGQCFFGKVTEYDDTEPPPLWHVVYDDGDEEDYGSRDLIKALMHYEKHGQNDKNASDVVHNNA